MKQQIENWRNSLYASGSFESDELDELESHLLDEVEQLNTDMLSAEEKLLVAQHRLGSSNQLRKAYQKKDWASFAQLSWGLQVLISFFLLREVAVQLSYASSLIINGLQSQTKLLNYAISIGIQTCGLLLLFLCFRFIIRLNYKRSSATGPNLLLMAVFLLIFLMRPMYTMLLGSPYVNYESVLIAQLISYLPVVMAFFAITSMSIKRWYKARKTLAHKTL